MADLTSAQQEGLALPALAVALQHRAISADQHIICNLLQVCRAWRTAVQRSSASLTDVKFEKRMYTREISRASSFASWLAKHPGLIGTLTIVDDEPQDADEQTSAAVLDATQQLVEFGMQAAAVVVGSVALLRLRSYTSSLPATAGLLAALPAATLTNLRLDSGGSSIWFSALSTLTSLQSLHLNVNGLQDAAANSCLVHIGTLRQVTQLHLCNITDGADMRLLPVQLQQLCLRYHGFSTALADLQHLVALKQLELNCTQLTDGSSLPPNLQSLNLYAEWPTGGLVGVTSMQQVTAIKLRGDEHLESMDLKSLEHLSQLKSLCLTLLSEEGLLHVAAAWHNLPLHELHISAGVLNVERWQQLMQHVAAARRLEKLRICVIDIQGVAQPHELRVCEYLKGLRDLESLALDLDKPHAFEKRDAENLSALVKLTQLELCSGPYIDATIVCMLAVTLTGLRVLAINHSDLPNENYRCINESVLPAIGRHHDFEVLRLEPLEHDVAVRGLQVLTNLTKLRDLQGFDEAGEDAWAMFEYDTSSQYQRMLS